MAEGYAQLDPVCNQLPPNKRHGWKIEPAREWYLLIAHNDSGSSLRFHQNIQLSNTAKWDYFAQRVPCTASGTTSSVWAFVGSNTTLASVISIWYLNEQIITTILCSCHDMGMQECVNGTCHKMSICGSHCSKNMQQVMEFPSPESEITHNTHL